MMMVLPRTYSAFVTCPQGEHSCGEINVSDFCCDNNSYCYLNRTLQANCCPLGSRCLDSPCAESRKACSLPSFEQSCCPRDCDSGEYLCTQGHGKVCCDYDAYCGLDEQGTSVCVKQQDLKPIASLVPTSATKTNPINILALGLGLGIPSALLTGLTASLYIVHRRKKVEKAKKLSQKAFEKPELCGKCAKERAELVDTGFRELYAIDDPRELSVTLEGLPHEIPSIRVYSPTS